METRVEAGSVHAASKIASVNRCVHGRLIDDVLTKNGQRSGKVRCLECGVQFDDGDGCQP